MIQRRESSFGGIACKSEKVISPSRKSIRDARKTLEGEVPWGHREKKTSKETEVNNRMNKRPNQKDSENNNLSSYQKSEFYHQNTNSTNTK